MCKPILVLSFGLSQAEEYQNFDQQIKNLINRSKVRSRSKHKDKCNFVAVVIVISSDQKLQFPYLKSLLWGGWLEKWGIKLSDLPS